MADFIVSGPPDSPVLLLAHGAGADARSEFLTQFAELLSERHIRTLRFEFEYMAKRRTGGNRSPPPKVEVLIDEMRETVVAASALVGREPLFIGGKSLGGRVATLVADSLYESGQIAGCVTIGYPFHPVGKPDKLRTGPLAKITCPLLIVQGTRDDLGSEDDVRAYDLSSTIEMVWLADGDHDLKPRRASGYTHDMHKIAAAEAIARFISELTAQH